MCKGTYTGWADSDDLLAPTALEETAAVLDTQPSIGAVYTDCLIINEKNQLKGLGHVVCRVNGNSAFRTFAEALLFS